MINLNAIGNKIRRLRTASSMTQAEFAERAGVSRATISALENGTIKEIGVNRLNEIVRCAENIRPRVARSEQKIGLRKSQVLGLSFPYDWSNSSMNDEVLIDQVIERGIFEDLVRIYGAYGGGVVTQRSEIFIKNNPAASKSLSRMLTNISKAGQVV